MFPCIGPILHDLRPCFSHQAAFKWFGIIIDLLIRCDHLGLTSIVRWLFLTPESYDLILRFFRATSWQLDSLSSQWAEPKATTSYTSITTSVAFCWTCAWLAVMPWAAACRKCLILPKV